MEVAAEWETALDAIADEIRDALDGEADASIKRSCRCARTVRVWVDALISLLLERQRQTDPDGVSEVLDVLASLLKASADGRWRHKQEERSVDDGFYVRQKLETIVVALDAAVNAAMDAPCEDTHEIRTYAIDILSSLLFNATTEVEVDTVLDILRHRVCKTPLANAIAQANTFLPDGNVGDATWATCFLRFALLMVPGLPRLTNESDDLIMLSSLTGAGDRVAQWIAETWETKWHVHRSAHIATSLFGAVEDCVAGIRNMFQGFSVGQDEVDSTAFPTVAAAVMAAREASKQVGLVHGVDVTVIKSGHIHPRWKDAGRQIRLQDMDQARTEGYTIGLRGVQARNLSVSNLCSRLQRELGQHVNANLYWTPPQQQGFDRHIDDHCVFAVQLKGRKRWVLYEPQEVLPLLYDDTASLLATHPPPFHAELILEEGDILYVPRGVAHHADTKDIDDESIHLTIGIEIEAKNSNGRIVDELKSLSSTDLTDLENLRNKGLMAWHFSDPRAFCNQVLSFTDMELQDDMTHALISLQQKLKNERALFLTQRSVRAHTMATLHAAFQSKPATDVDKGSVRAKKKQRTH